MAVVVLVLVLVLVVVKPVVKIVAVVVIVSLSRVEMLRRSSTSISSELDELIVLEEVVLMADDMLLDDCGVVAVVDKLVLDKVVVTVCSEEPVAVLGEQAVKSIKTAVRARGKMLVFMNSKPPKFLNCEQYKVKVANLSSK